MAASTYGGSTAVFGSSLPLVWKPVTPRSRFGDAAVLVFLVAQCFDGVFTYVGVMSFGIGIEANPVIAGLMVELGHGPALLLAKSVACALGIALHLGRVHGAVALLAAFYVTAAVVPWMTILFV
jgi:hypothetical protein